MDRRQTKGRLISVRESNSKPNQHGSTSIATQSESQHCRVKGMETKFGIDSVANISEGFHLHGDSTDPWLSGLGWTLCPGASHLAALAVLILGVGNHGQQ